MIFDHFAQWKRSVQATKKYQWLPIKSTDEIVLDHLRKHYEALDLVFNNPKEQTMTEVTVKVDNNNPDTVTVNGEVYERKVPVLTLEERVIAELDDIQIFHSTNVEDCLYAIGNHLSKFHRRNDNRWNMLRICLYARQILKLKGVDVEGIDRQYDCSTQVDLAYYISRNIGLYHLTPADDNITNIYHASLRWLMNDLENNTK